MNRMINMLSLFKRLETIDKTELDLLNYRREIDNSIINKIQDCLYIIDNIMYAQKLLDNPAFKQQTLVETRRDLFDIKIEYEEKINRYNELCIEHNRTDMKRIIDFEKLLYQQITIYKSDF